jgi:hypothetical protein
MVGAAAFVGLAMQSCLVRLALPARHHQFTWPQVCSLLIRRIMRDPEEYAYSHLVKLAAGP